MCLIIDDDADTVTLYQRYLHEASYRVEAVSSGDQLASLVRASAPDVVLLDVLMPQQDGWKTLQRLKTMPETTRARDHLLGAQPAIARHRLGRCRGAPNRSAARCFLGRCSGFWRRKMARCRASTRPSDTEPRVRSRDCRCRMVIGVAIAIDRRRCPSPK